MPDFAKLRRLAFPLIPIGAFCAGLLPQDASNPWMMAPFVVLSSFLLLSGRLSSLSLRDPILLLLLLLWLGWTWGGIFSAMPISSRVTLIMLGMLPVSYLTMYGRDVKILLYFLTGLMSVTAIFAIAEVSLLEIPLWRAQLFLHDSNTLGCLFAIAVPLALSFFFGTTNKKIRVLLYLSLALLVSGIVATQSRSALIAGAAGAGFVLYKNRDHFSKKFLHYGLPILLVLIAGFFITTFGERLIDALKGDKDVMGRIALWQAAFQMLAINPWHGVGLGIFHLYYPHYRLQPDNSAGFWVHMDPLQWAVETGWATAIVFYTLCGYVFFRSLKRDTTQEQVGAAGALATIFLCGHASYIFHYPPIMVLTGGLLTLFTKLEFSQLRRRFIVAVALIIVLLANLWSVMLEVPTLYFWRKGMEAYQIQDTQAYSRHMTNCIERGDPSFPACRIHAAEVMIGASDNPPAEVLVWLREADKAVPNAAEIMMLRARYHLKKYPNQPELAEDELRQALKRNPTYWPARSLLVRLLMLQTRYDAALDALTPAKNYWLEGHTYNEYHDLERQIREKLGQ